MPAEPKYTRTAAGVHSDAPIFIARFEDGHETCTAVFCAPTALEVRHGVRLADRARRWLLVTALELMRKKRLAGEPVDEETAARIRASLQTTPQIVAARFEFDGAVLQSYDAAALAAVLPRFGRTGT